MEGPRGTEVDESGFTLIEVLITIVILGFIASGVAASIILFFRTTDGTTSRLALSHDSQLLATYLVPDLDSLTAATPGGQPSVPSSNPPNCSSSTGVSFSDLQIQYTDQSSVPQQVYLADYQVSGSVITRTLSIGGVVQPAGVTEVVHNLKPGSLPSCRAAAGPSAPWTVTVTTEANNDPTTDYTFSVTGGGRVTLPTPPGPPRLCDPKVEPLVCTSPPLISQPDSAGKIASIVVTFDQPLNILAGTPQSLLLPQWNLLNPPNGVTLGSVSVSGDQVILGLNNPLGTVQTGNSFEVALVTNPSYGIRNGANQPAALFPATPVTNGIAPLPLTIVSQDLTDAAGSPGPDGRIDHVVVTFSATLGACPQSTCPTAQWTLTDPPGDTGVSLNSVSVSGSTATLTLNEGTTFDTAPSYVFTVALRADPAGIQDPNGNQASFPATPVADGMTPAPISIVSQDLTDAAANPGPDGKIDHIVVTFSELLDTAYSAGTGPWTLSNPPTGVTINSVNVSGSTATLTLAEGTTFDTAANGLQLSLAAAPGGIRRSASPQGNASSFTKKPVSDGMGPVVIAMTSIGGTAGKLETGDTVTLTFSEPVAIKTGPATLTLTPAGASTNDTVTIPGLVTIDLGVRNTYVMNSAVTVPVSVTNPVMNNSAVVMITVGSPISSASNVETAQGPSPMTVTPSPAVKDRALPANAAAGTSKITTELF